MKSTTKVVSLRRIGLRLQSSNSNDSHLLRRLQDLKDQSTVDKKDPLVRLTHLTETEFSNDWATEEDKLNADKVLEIVDAQKKVAKMNQSHSSASDEKRGGVTESQAQAEAFQYINKMPGTTFQDRLESAQSRAIKYKLRQEKISQARDENEQSQFRQLYTERFTPIGSFEKLESLADRRIEESMKQGGFQGLGADKIRGKPADLPKPNPHLSTTQHYLNNILVKQNIVPPWIEKQSSVNRDISNLRNDLLRGFEEELASFLKKFKLINENSDLKAVHASIARSYGSSQGFVRYRFENWKNSRKAAVEKRITIINSALRTYNLQAPLPTQKLYLLPNREFQRVWDHIDVGKIVDEEIQHAKNKRDKEELSARAKSPSLRAFFKLW